MTLFTADEIEGLLQDTGGVAVVYRGQSTWGHWQQATEVVPTDAGGFVEVLGEASGIRVAAGKVTGLAQGEPIEVDGAPYYIRQWRAVNEDAPEVGEVLIELYEADS